MSFYLHIKLIGKLFFIFQIKKKKIRHSKPLSKAHSISVLSAQLPRFEHSMLIVRETNHPVQLALNVQDPVTVQIKRRHRMGLMP